MNAREAAEACGLPPMLSYTPAETALYTGVSYRCVLEEVKAGRLRSYIKRGQSRGYRIKPEWVDEWMGGDAS